MANEINETTEAAVPAAPKDYKVTAITYNLANKNPSKKGVENFVEQLGLHKNTTEGFEIPDVLVFSLQEAGNSFFKGEDLAKRMLKRKPFSDQYDIIYSDGFNVRTKFASWFSFNVPQTRLIVAVKKDMKKDTLVVDPHFVREKGFIKNKGGVTAQLWIGDKKIGIAAVHMHSESEEKRKEQADEIKAIFKKQKTDGSIILGDLNERFLNPGGFDGSEPQETGHTKEKVQSRAYVLEAAKNVQETSAWSEYEFGKVTKVTYAQENEKGQIKYKEKRGVFDVGVLDNVLISNGDNQSKEPLIKFVTKTESKNTESAVSSVLEEGEISTNAGQHDFLEISSENSGSQKEIRKDEDLELTEIAANRLSARVFQPEQSGEAISDHCAVVANLEFKNVGPITKEFRTIKELLALLEQKITGVSKKSSAISHKNTENSFENADKSSFILIRSRYFLQVEGKNYPVPRRVYELHKQLTDGKKDHAAILEGVIEYCNSSEFTKGSRFTVEKTQTFLQEFKKNHVDTINAIQKAEKDDDAKNTPHF